MAEQDYVGSLAQTAISYTTVINNQTVPGQNYWQVGLFVDSVADAAANLVTGYVINTPIELNSSNYSSYVKKGSILEGWLQSFFGANSTSSIFVVVYNGTTHDIATAHASLLTLSYFKMVFFGSGGESNQYQDDVVSLASYATANSMLSQAVVCSASPTLLLASGTGYGNLDALIAQAGADAMMQYSAITSYNAGLTNLGLCLGITNQTGTPVGNNLDFVATNNILPSTGSVNNVNLSSVSVSNLKSRKIGYFSTVGDGSGNVYLDNRFSVAGDIVTANWLVNYCDFVCSLKTSTLLTNPSNLTFKNNATYQQILTIINSVITPFQTNLGRLSNLSIDAVTFQKLPATGGSVLTIPNAWRAAYNDRIGSVNVNGTLNVTL